MELSKSDINDLRSAKAILENQGLVSKVSGFVGTPIEKLLKRLPESLTGAVNEVARKSIEKALDIALLTIVKNDQVSSSNWWHKLAVAVTGAGGGAFGLPALAIELPISTTIMLRSIADIARSEGEDLSTAEAKLQCLQVLALGGNSKSDDAAESVYFAARAALAKSVSEAATHLAEKGLSKHGASALVRLISQITSRFSIVVSEKAAAQAVPVVGAFGGAVINTLFIDHFQDMGRGHFIVRRLERQYGEEDIRRLYDEI
jgi:hypothetical protein